MIKIVPTVLARTAEEFQVRMERLLVAADELQVDFEDGNFVPSKGVSVSEIPDLRKYAPVLFEAHLMVDNPGAYIQPLANRGFARVIIPVEVINRQIFTNLKEQCERYKLRIALVINPETPIDELLPYVHEIDGVMFMGVHPGFNGAPYVPETADRIRAFLKKNRNDALIIQVDGGMSPQTIGAVVAAGATRINSGSFVSNAPDVKAAMIALQRAADTAATTSSTTISATLPARVPREMPTNIAHNEIAPNKIAHNKILLNKKLSGKTVAKRIHAPVQKQTTRKSRTIQSNKKKPKHNTSRASTAKVRSAKKRSVPKQPTASSRVKQSQRKAKKPQRSTKRKARR